MALSSMTGFARSHGAQGDYAFEWEIRAVNAKGFDLRLRLPPGWDALEPVVRKKAAAVLSRGTVQAGLSVKRLRTSSEIRVNEDVLESVLRVTGDIARRIDARPPAVDGILAIKGVVEIVEPEETDEERAAAEAAVVAAFDRALADLCAMRLHEGATLGSLLHARLDELSALAARADAAPGRKPEAIKARLATQISTLLDSAQRFDPDRLHQEAVLIAAKADIREELDRLSAHIAQARKLIATGGAVGRKLDFLCQELNREANTVCSKSNDLALTNIGLELKSVIEQFREQVQNIE